MKTPALIICLTLWLSPTMGATAPSPHRQLQDFATCAGRLSAVVEHQWLFDGQASERTQQQRATVISLIEATITPDQGPAVLHWRITAKLAHAALLTRAVFNDDPNDAAWAAALAARYTNECTSLILS